MLESLNSTTSCLELGTSVLGGSTTLNTTVNEDGTFEKKGCIASALSSSMTSATGLASEYHTYKLTQAEAYVESLSAEELAKLSAQLEQKYFELEFDNTKVKQNNNAPKTM